MLLLGNVRGRLGRAMDIYKPESGLASSSSCFLPWRCRRRRCPFASIMPAEEFVRWPRVVEVEILFRCVGFLRRQLSKGLGNPEGVFFVVSFVQVASNLVMRGDVSAERCLLDLPMGFSSF